MNKITVYIPTSIDLIAEQSLECDYLIDAGEHVVPTEGYFFTPEQLVEKLKEAYNAGYDRCGWGAPPHEVLEGFPPSEDEYIEQLNTK
jgi:hypothetical protein